MRLSIRLPQAPVDEEELIKWSSLDTKTQDNTNTLTFRLKRPKLPSTTPPGAQNLVIVIIYPSSHHNHIYTTECSPSFPIVSFCPKSFHIYLRPFVFLLTIVNSPAWSPTHLILTQMISNLIPFRNLNLMFALGIVVRTLVTMITSTVAGFLLVNLMLMVLFLSWIEISKWTGRIN